MTTEENTQLHHGPAVMPPSALPALVSNPHTPKLYMQSFANFASAIDVSMVVVNCNVATALVTMTYPTAKSLAKALSDSVQSYEKAMGITVIATDEAQEKLASAPI